MENYRVLQAARAPDEPEPPSAPVLALVRRGEQVVVEAARGAPREPLVMQFAMPGDALESFWALSGAPRRAVRVDVWARVCTSADDAPWPVSLPDPLGVPLYAGDRAWVGFSAECGAEAAAQWLAGWAKARARHAKVHETYSASVAAGKLQQRKDKECAKERADESEGDDE